MAEFEPAILSLSSKDIKTIQSYLVGLEYAINHDMDFTLSDVTQSKEELEELKKTDLLLTHPDAHLITTLLREICARAIDTLDWACTVPFKPSPEYFRAQVHQAKLDRKADRDHLKALNPSSSFLDSLPQVRLLRGFKLRKTYISLEKALESRGRASNHRLRRTQTAVKNEFIRLLTLDRTKSLERFTQSCNQLSTYVGRQLNVDDFHSLFELHISIWIHNILIHRFNLKVEEMQEIDKSLTRSNTFSFKRQTATL